MDSIFLIDDQIYNLKIIQQHLSEKFTVDYFYPGDTLLTILENNPALYFIGIIDYMMPKVSGINLAKKIRSFNTTIPIIFISAYFSDFSEFSLLNEVKDLSLENTHYIPKPISKEKLFDIINLYWKEL